ncbi:hypothetical protein D9757_004088 [Collybiopsis confluens]|uniref:Uncharacterized protein n=1 Tax=Collybiopsis confluens TaxID=2823264 RepID=A0A8H5HU29_9AGAR|nr:hypothetical protein D9757_004088 [Collybiopsis confluens]
MLKSFSLFHFSMYSVPSQFLSMYKRPALLYFCPHPHLLLTMYGLKTFIAATLALALGTRLVSAEPIATDVVYHCGTTENPSCPQTKDIRVVDQLLNLMVEPAEFSLREKCPEGYTCCRSVDGGGICRMLGPGKVCMF